MIQHQGQIPAQEWKRVEAQDSRMESVRRRRKQVVVE
jgi:hypothetical protein